MTDLDLRDLPTKDLLESYKEKFPLIDSTSILLFLDFQKVSREMTHSFNQLFEEHDLTEAKFTLLMLLYRQPNYCLLPSELAEKAGVKRSTITGIVTGLIKKNWVTKIANSIDKRSFFICLTSEGQQKLENFLPINYSLNSRMMQHLAEDEKEQFHYLLEKIRQGILEEAN
ncbi:MarR family winged helix-turn-helix transcriptional regulator [Carnobacterium gallinarum]|uniref:MarR family winged helix-turn-helix transcriptional regulator n=1 Tax=Carnobacterium gallinarum TaxID=2749 RepID=UPI000557EF35|nr:MarR family transcriptional regulator [Carnobacterium gallinarum]